MSKVETRPRPPRMRSTGSSADEAAESTAEFPAITMTPSTASDPAVLTAADNSEVGTGSATAVAAAIRVRYRVPCSGIIGKALYHSTRTSSSRMSSHLRFVIVTAANPDNFLIDEALSTGDTSFKERSKNKMTQLRRDAGTVSIVNHAAQVVEEICTRDLRHLDGDLTGGSPGPQIDHGYRWWSWSTAKDKPKKTAQIPATCREKWKPTGVRIQRSEGRMFPLPNTLKE